MESLKRYRFKFSFPFEGDDGVVSWTTPDWNYFEAINDDTARQHITDVCSIPTLQVVHNGCPTDYYQKVTELEECVPSQEVANYRPVSL